MDDRSVEAALGAEKVYRSWAVGLSILVLLMLMTVGCNPARNEAIRQMNEGLALAQEGKTSDGIELLKEAVKADNTYAEPRYYMGQLYHLRLKDLDNAERYYREALVLEPENPQFAYRLGTVLAEQGKHEEGVKVFARGLEAKPDYAKAWFRNGLSLEALGRFPEAVESYTKAIEANPRMKMDKKDPGGEAYHALGDLYIRFGLHDKAIKVYDNGVLNNPGTARLYHGRGVAQLKLERYADAAESFEEVLKVEARHPSAAFNLAVARQQLGEREAAMEVLERYLQMATTSDDQARVMAAQGLLQQLRQQ